MRKGHAPFCFAGEPAPCPGYFENDVLPCVCGDTQDVLHALEQVQVPAAPIADTEHGELEPVNQPRGCRRRSEFRLPHYRGGAQRAAGEPRANARWRPTRPPQAASLPHAEE